MVGKYEMKCHVNQMEYKLISFMRVGRLPSFQYVASMTTSIVVCFMLRVKQTFASGFPGAFFCPQIGLYEY